MLHTQGLKRIGPSASLASFIGCSDALYFSVSRYLTLKLAEAKSTPKKLVPSNLSLNEQLSFLPFKATWTKAAITAIFILLSNRLSVF